APDDRPPAPVHHHLQRRPRAGLGSRGRRVDGRRQPGGRGAAGPGPGGPPLRRAAPPRRPRRGRPPVRGLARGRVVGERVLLPRRELGAIVNRTIVRLTAQGMLGGRRLWLLGALALLLVVIAVATRLLASVSEADAAGLLR